MQRNRLKYAAAIAVVIVAGLASRSGLAEHLPAFVATYAGDALWALTVFLTIGFILPGLSISAAAIAAFVISFGVEISQLYQANWINQIRATWPGALLLGAGFKWSDLVCYTTGIMMGIAGESLIRMWQKESAPE